MHLGLGRTQSSPLSLELLSIVHVAEQWRHEEVQKKKKGKGKRRW